LGKEKDDPQNLSDDRWVGIVYHLRLLLFLDLLLVLVLLLLLLLFTLMI